MLDGLFSRRARPQAVRATPFPGSPCPPLRLQEVHVVAVETRDGRVLLTIVEVSPSVAIRQSWVVGGTPAPGILARLDGWCAAGSSLLLFTDEDDAMHLLAPDGTTTGLSVFELHV